MAGKPVTHTVTCDEIFLELDQTVSVALIVSELVTNCLKHAFKDGSQGHIAIIFRQYPEQRELVLTISDDGCGATTPCHSKGLGKTIINGLAAQLHACMTWENVGGTTVTLRFPMRQAPQPRTNAPRPSVPSVSPTLLSPTMTDAAETQRS